MKLIEVGITTLLLVFVLILGAKMIDAILDRVRNNLVVYQIPIPYSSVYITLYDADKGGGRILSTYNFDKDDNTLGFVDSLFGFIPNPYGEVCFNGDYGDCYGIDNGGGGVIYAFKNYGTLSDMLVNGYDAHGLWKKVIVKTGYNPVLSPESPINRLFGDEGYIDNILFDGVPNRYVEEKSLWKRSHGFGNFTLTYDFFAYRAQAGSEKDWVGIPVTYVDYDNWTTFELYYLLHYPYPITTVFNRVTIELNFPSYFTRPTNAKGKSNPYNGYTTHLVYESRISVDSQLYGAYDPNGKVLEILKAPTVKIDGYDYTIVQGLRSIFETKTKYSFDSDFTVYFGKVKVERDINGVESTVGNFNAEEMEIPVISVKDYTGYQLDFLSSGNLVADPIDVLFEKSGWWVFKEDEGKKWSLSFNDDKT